MAFLMKKIKRLERQIEQLQATQEAKEENEPNSVKPDASRGRENYHDIVTNETHSLVTCREAISSQMSLEKETTQQNTLSIFN